ncbi:hypothetical protein ACFE04_026662 [Oxalis oulophora]
MVAVAARRGGGRGVGERLRWKDAKGRTLWSRAILTNRLKIKFRKQTSSKIQRLKKSKSPSSTAAIVTGSSNSRSMRRTRVSVLRLKMKSLPAATVFNRER